MDWFGWRDEGFWGSLVGLFNASGTPERGGEVDVLAENTDSCAMASRPTSVGVVVTLWQVGEL